MMNATLTHGILVTEHNMNEWHRMAQDAYNTGRSAMGHRYSVAAAVLTGKLVSPAVYDGLQINYRRWLIGGWTLVETGELPSTGR